MASVTGKESTIAAKVNTGPWGDAAEVAVGALDGILVASESISKAKEMVKDESVATPFQRNITGTNVTIEGGLTGDLRYENWDLMLALIFGADAVTQPDAPNSPSVYDHLFTLAEDVLGNFATIVIDKITRIHVVPTFKPTGFTISGDSGGVLSIEVTGIGNDRIYNSTTNQQAQVDAVTYKTRLLSIPFNIGVFRLNEQSTGALASPADDVCPNSFSLSIALPLEGDQVACGTDQIAEPDYTGMPEIKLELGFPRVITALPAFVDLMDNETLMKGDITYTGPIANEGETAELNHFWKTTMPALKILNADELVENAGKIPVTAEFELIQADAAPTGFTFTEPMQMTMRNTDTRDHIA